MGSILKLIVENYHNNIAIANSTSGNSVRYKEVIGQANNLKEVLKGLPQNITKQFHQTKCKQDTPSYYAQRRVGLLCQPNQNFVQSILAAWLSNDIIVPLGLPHPTQLLEYQIQKVGVDVVITDKSNLDKILQVKQNINRELHILPAEDIFNNDVDIEQRFVQAQNFLNQYSEEIVDDDEKGRLILFTSGTTGAPKGVLHNQRSLQCQIQSLSQAWEFTSSDRVLNCLPQHHIHGLVNGSLLPLANGGSVEYMQYNPKRIFKAVQSGSVNVFTAVPSMYVNMIDYYKKHLSQQDQSNFREAAQDLRLWMCGSAPCSIPTLESWREISGNYPLERYGMTETGMILSNPYRGDRRPSFVGQELPAVSVKIYKDKHEDDPPQEGLQEDDQRKGGGTQCQGQLAVKSQALFSEYWEDEKATKESFDKDGYFMTGDVVSYEGDPAMFKILGRASADIIKSYGYKISALDIENQIRLKGKVRDCAVMGVTDRVSGEAILCLIEVQPDLQQQDLSQGLADYNNIADLKLQEGSLQLYKSEKAAGKLSIQLRESLASYQIPKHYFYCTEIPRNAMGKVNKKTLRKAMEDFIQ